MAFRSMTVTVALVALLAACTADDGAAPDSTSPEPPTVGVMPGRPSPRPPVVEPEPWFGPPVGPPIAPSPEEAPKPDAEELAALGVVLSAGFTPHAHLRRDDGDLVWPPPDDRPESIGDPPVPEGLGPLHDRRAHRALPAVLHRVDAHDRRGRRR